MKCKKCNGEWTPPPGKSITVCPFCAEPVAKITDIEPTDNVIKTLAQQYGDEVLLDSKLTSLVADTLMNKEPQLFKRLRLAINEKVPKKLHDLKSVSVQEREIGIRHISSRLTEDYGTEAEKAYEIVNYFGAAFGYEPVSAPNMKQSYQISQTEQNTRQSSQSTISKIATPPINSIIKFGKYDWRVLDVQNGQALLITENIITTRKFDLKSNRWGSGCEIYDWLNGEFYRELCQGNNNRIISADNITGNNPLCPESKGSEKTRDNVFLLSLDEVCRYFGDSTANLQKYSITENDFYISDENDPKRVATHNGKASWWWLRSPGIDSDYAADVDFDGCVDVFGSHIDAVMAVGGVRPALWLNLGET